MLYTMEITQATLDIFYLINEAHNTTFSKNQIAKLTKQM